MSSPASAIALRLASAPCTWGVWERTIGRDDLIPPDRMLALVRGLGYTGIELGPPGYFGADAESVSELLGSYRLELVGAFAPLRIDDEEGFREDLALLDRTIEILAATGARGPIVLAGAENDARLAIAGRPERTHENGLKGDDFKRAADRIERAADRARAGGVAAAFHPETGSYIEHPDEVAALLDATDPGLVTLAFDTGHAVVGGGDPVELAHAARDRIGHLHLKDVDPVALARVRSGELTVGEAWDSGMFCPFGEGNVDFAGVLAALQGFDGWAVVEQDRVAVLLDDLDSIRDVEERNLAVLEQALSGATASA
jgi:inosose dehydratase